MHHREYRIDFNGKRAIFDSKTRNIVAIVLETEQETTLTDVEELHLVYLLYFIESCERNGKGIGEHLGLNILGGRMADLMRKIHEIKEQYRLENITLYDPKLKKRRMIVNRQAVGVTTLPNGWHRFSNEYFSQLMYDWIEGRLDYLHTYV